MKVLGALSKTYSLHSPSAAVQRRTAVLGQLSAGLAKKNAYAYSFCQGFRSAASLASRQSSASAQVKGIPWAMANAPHSTQQSLTATRVDATVLRQPSGRPAKIWRFPTGRYPAAHSWRYCKGRCRVPMARQTSSALTTDDATGPSEADWREHQLSKVIDAT